MTGTYEHSIDAKGRLFIPAKLREELGVTFYLAMGVDACLAIYPQSTWDRFTEKFSSLPMSQSKAMRPLFANAAKCELDSQGRIVIPPEAAQVCRSGQGRGDPGCQRPGGDLERGRMAGPGGGRDDAGEDVGLYGGAWILI